MEVPGRDVTADPLGPETDTPDAPEAPEVPDEGDDGGEDQAVA